MESLLPTHYLLTNNSAFGRKFCGKEEIAFAERFHHTLEQEL